MYSKMNQNERTSVQFRDSDFKYLYNYTILKYLLQTDYLPDGFNTDEKQSFSLISKDF